MTPTPTERVSDEILGILIEEVSVGGSGSTYEILRLALTELQQRRSSPPSDRGAVIEEQEEIATLRRHLEVACTVADRLSGGGVWRNSHMRELAERWRAALSTPPKDSGNG